MTYGPHGIDPINLGVQISAMTIPLQQKFALVTYLILLDLHRCNIGIISRDLKVSAKLKVWIYDITKSILGHTGLHINL